MNVPRKIETQIRVRFEECQPGGEIRASAFLRYAQDAAWVHSDLAGFDRAWYLRARPDLAGALPDARRRRTRAWPATR